MEVEVSCIHQVQVTVPQERNLVPLNRGPDGPQSQCGHFGTEIKLLSLLEFEPQTS